VRPVTLEEVARILKAELTAGSERSLVRGAAADSRVAREGDLFFALRGRLTPTCAGPPRRSPPAPSRCRPSSSKTPWTPCSGSPDGRSRATTHP
jgi:hypothetical protein